MKKYFVIIFSLLLVLIGMFGCTAENNRNNNVNGTTPPIVTTKKTLIAYFSCTGTTARIAKLIAEETGAVLHEIQPEVPYTEEDLNYYSGSRADREQADPTIRPAIANGVENMQDYDVVFLGYPIWHGQAPKIIYTFLESYDLSGKIIIPFCTSHTSDIGSSDDNLHSLTVNADWKEGRRFESDTNAEMIVAWLEELDLKLINDVSSFDLKNGENGRAPTVTLNSGYEMPILGLGTYSLHGDTCKNSVRAALESGVRLIDTASAYGNEEEIGEAIREAIADRIVKRDDIFVITKIYPGSEMANPERSIQACLDRLNIGYVDMMLLHHPDSNDVKAYKAMERFVESGQIRSLGLSNWYIDEIDDFITQVDIMPALVQNEIHLYYQEQDVVPYMHNLGIVVQAWYPFGGRGHTGEILNDPTVVSIAKTHRRTSAQIILRWHLQRGVVAIPGSSNPDHIRENISVFDFSLTEEEMAAIAALERGEKHDWY